MLISRVILLIFLLTVVVNCSFDYRNSHKRGVAFYGYDWDDNSYGGGMEDNDMEEQSPEEEKEEPDWIEKEDEWEEDEEEDRSWKKDEENYDHTDEEEDEEPSKHFHHHKHKHYYPKPPPPPYHKPPHHHPPRPIVKVDIVTRPKPHRGNFKDGYSNGYAAGLRSPFSHDHTIEYLHTVTSCEIHKRVDVIDGVSYTFSSLASVTGPITVTKTMVDFDGHVIEIPLTNGQEQLSRLPMDGVTRTVVAVEDEATTLPIRTRRRQQQRQPPSDQRQFMQDLPQRLGLDDGGSGWGKVLAVGDDGIRGTVLKNIVYDENGDPIIPTRAGTRQVYVINDKTTTLKNGVPTPFPADNGHTRTVIALRNGMVTLPLTGADEFTKLLPIEGVTETIAVFDDVSYTLAPDHTDKNGHVVHQTIPSQVIRTVVVEEILNSNASSANPSVKSAEFPSRELIETSLPNIYALPADLSSAINSVVPPEPKAATLNLPVPFDLPVATDSVSSSGPKTSTLNLLVPSDLGGAPITPSGSKTATLSLPATRSIPMSSSIESPGPLSILLSSLFHAPPIQPVAPQHCPNKLVLDSKRKSEGCYSLAGLEVMDSEIREVESQGYWTDQACHGFCESSHHLANATTSWYYGLTMSTDGGSSTCRCITRIDGSRPSQHCRVAPGSLQQRPYHLGEVGDFGEPAIYIYQATYRCLSPSLMKRRQLKEDCRTTELQSKRASEGCYPYLAPKVTVSQTRHQGQDVWTAAACYSFCQVSGRVPVRAPWYYGLVTSTDETECLCMLEMGASPTKGHCVDLPGTSNTTKAGVVNPDDLDNAAIYAYKVTYQCPSCASPKQIGDTMATEGCYAMADYAAQSIKKITRDIDEHGVYTPKECFDLCLNSGLMVPGQTWWYGISKSDPVAAAFHGWSSTTSCRCSIQAPASTIGSGRCHNAVGLVDDRFLYRVNNGVYVYKVAFQC